MSSPSAPTAPSDPTTAARARTLALLIPVVVAPSVGSLAALWLSPGAFGSAIYAVCKSVLYGIPLFVAFRETSWEEMRKGIHRGKAGIGWALLGSVVVALGGWLAWEFLGLSDLETTGVRRLAHDNGLDTALGYGLFAAWLCVGNSGLEELVFRWFVDSRLRRLGLRAVAVTLTSATVFTAHHVIVLGAFFSVPVVCMGALGVFAGGALWSWSLRKWGSLIPGWLMHALVDAVILAIGAAWLF